MIINEGKRKVPIRFYQDKYGTIIYDSSFTQGTARSLKDAFDIFSTKDFGDDLLYYYDDVTDYKIGRFIPAIENKTWKGMKYLGLLEVTIDTTDLFRDSKNSISYLSKHKNEIPRHQEWIKNMKKAVNEIFDPEKTNNDLICKHCGSIIPTGTYYERYRNDAYHLECIWDKLINKRDSDTYEEAKEYFFSLQKHIGNWPAYGLDVEDDYVRDLQLVKHNYRISESLNIEKLNEKLRKLLRG